MDNMHDDFLNHGNNPLLLIINDVVEELERAVDKFPEYPTDPLHALSILGEEYGELNKSVLQYTYEPQKTSKEEIRSEAIQTAAMAIRFLISLEDFDYKKSQQHKQEL
jgi:NTP pyrophosphatase (non-canonical NTP hydrolase)